MKRSTVCLNAVVFLAVSGSTHFAWAHLPVFDDGTAVDADHALVISDIGLSQVVYHEVTDPAQPLWIAFDAGAGQELYFNPGVPAIDRLKDYRPTFALVGPGLPPTTLPFAIPGGDGAEVYPTTDIADPTFFHEPFSGTDSWILFKKTVTLPQSGRYYLVGYVPSGQPGKFWVAIGKREEFGPDAIGTLPQDIARVRAFHESSATTAPCFLIPLGFVGTLFGVRFISRRRAASVSSSPSERLT
ncbi:MAG TPA: hypothetical protein PKY77_23270 [Phycisphaerae bacterium]|nr:hypothetical protein [Phycisphaerae bacterium]HRY70156.1 hypothetical protein [Phycisphaerae bacterium]HSA29677.1 hypothetical protein [Phycisphaerae bacterium]